MWLNDLPTWADYAAEEDLFRHNEGAFAFHRKSFRFELARSVFASAAVDPGSSLLLRHLQSCDLNHVQRVLDIGCGHGTLGIVLQALDPGRDVTSVDRDALACRYTVRNLRLNGLDEARHSIFGSLGYDELTGHEPYDLVVSNLPGKVGDAVIAHLVSGAAAVARVGTILGFVVVKPLASLVIETVDAASFERLLVKGNKTHEVIIARIVEPILAPSSTSFEQGLYDRNEREFSYRSFNWNGRSVSGLNEFDGLSYPTQMLRGALQGVEAGPAVVVNPGQGHRAVIAGRSGYPPSVLLSRDLLALRASSRCLVDAGLPAPKLVHDITVRAALADGHTLVIAHADEKVHGPWFVDQVQRSLDHLEGTRGQEHRDLVLTGRSGLLGRLEADVLRKRRGHVAYKQSRRGFRALRYRVSG